MSKTETKIPIHHVLFVDDEPQVLKSLARIFRKEANCRVHTANSGAEGLAFLQDSEFPVSLIISDQRMPQMNGSEFLEKAKAIYPEAVRFMLTGYSDLEAVVKAVNKGEIHRYLTKPWNDDDLRLQVRQGLQQYELVADNRRLQEVTQKQNAQLYHLGKKLDQKIKDQKAGLAEKDSEIAFLNKELAFNLQNMVSAFDYLMDQRFPALKAHGRQVGRFAGEIAQKLDLAPAQIRDIEQAAQLHDIGKLALPDRLVNKAPKNLGPEEKKALAGHPEIGQQIVSFVRGMEEVGLLIRHHHERFDGQGYPDGLAEDDIPLGGRVIAIADAYDNVVRKGAQDNDQVKAYLKSQDLVDPDMPAAALLTQAAIHRLKTGSFSDFEPELVKAAIRVLQEKGVSSRQVQQLAVDQLKPGMVLIRSLYTTRGRFLMPHNTVLTEAQIQKLQSVDKEEPIGPIDVEIPASS